MLAASTGDFREGSTQYSQTRLPLVIRVLLQERPSTVSFPMLSTLKTAGSPYMSFIPALKVSDPLPFGVCSFTNAASAGRSATFVEVTVFAFVLTTYLMPF